MAIHSLHSSDQKMGHEEAPKSSVESGQPSEASKKTDEKSEKEAKQSKKDRADTEEQQEKQKQQLQKEQKEELQKEQLHHHHHQNGREGEYSHPSCPFAKPTKEGIYIQATTLRSRIDVAMASRCRLSFPGCTDKCIEHDYLTCHKGK